jgi:signal transduction histidine kinase
MRVKPNRDLVAFAGGLAHELANIFTAAAGNLSLLESGPGGGGIYRQALGDAQRSYVRGFALVERLKAVAGLRGLAAEASDLNRLTAEAAGAARQNLPPGLAVVLKLTEDDCTAVVDREKFAEAVAAVIENAAEAAGEGSLAIETSVVGDCNTDYVRVAVRDAGPGMTADFAARACDPLVTSKPQHFRHGWGLALCEGFVRQSGGYLEIDSETGRGTCVALLLPRAKAPAPEEA